MSLRSLCLRQRDRRDRLVKEPLFMMGKRRGFTWHKEFNPRGRWTKAGGAQAGDWPQWMVHYKDY